MWKKDIYGVLKFIHCVVKLMYLVVLSIYDAAIPICSMEMHYVIK